MTTPLDFEVLALLLPAALAPTRFKLYKERYHHNFHAALISCYLSLLRREKNNSEKQYLCISMPRV